jgi:hypothetical protein
MSERVKALELLEKITDFDNNGVSHEELLEYLIKNFLSGDRALECMEAAAEEFNTFIDEEDGDSDDDVEEILECPNCMSSGINLTWDFIYDTGDSISKCNDCGHTDEPSKFIQD